MSDAVDLPNRSAVTASKSGCLAAGVSGVRLAWTKSAGVLAFQIRRFRSRQNSEIVMLIDECVGPAFYPNVFVTTHFVKALKKPNTCCKVLCSIGMARTWAKSKGRDLDHDLRTGHFIGIDDVESLADYLIPGP